jgi:hypothetical protein
MREIWETTREQQQVFCWRSEVRQPPHHRMSEKNRGKIVSRRKAQEQEREAHNNNLPNEAMF